MLNGHLALRGQRLPPHLPTDRVLKERTMNAKSDERVTRKNSPPIKVYCLPNEKERIRANATEAGHSPSSFLREVGQGYRVWSVVDYDRVNDLLRVNADLGRLGGLLKMWLSDDDRLAQFDDAELEATIRAVLTRIDGTQDELRGIARSVLSYAPANFSR